MAKAKKRKTPSRVGNSSEKAAYELAALHWYALTIERLCMQLYVTDAGNLGQIKGALNDALAALNHIKNAAAAGCDECQDGWECCKADNLCAPTCVNQDQ